MAILDLVGQRFGRLLVASYHSVKPYGATVWTCKCDCGKEVVALSNNLRRGLTQSCGCAHKGANKTHGQSDTRMYSIWCGMKQRCNGINTSSYKEYGGRGILVCAEWLNSFETFKKWAIENGYTDVLSIDRINNDGNYSSDNCRWAADKEQCRNRRSNRILTNNGIAKTVAEWSEETGIKSNTIRRRIDAYGWDVNKALTTSR